MTSIRRFTCDDLLTYNNVNLDTLTETYNLPFYLTYLAKWPEYCQVAPDYRRQRLANKLMDSLEQVTEKEHSEDGCPMSIKSYGLRVHLVGTVHLAIIIIIISSSSSSSSCCNLGIFHNGYFVDLFVRKSNDVAVGMYRKLGYVVYREVLGYYSGEENAYDMRKAMARDVQRKSVVPLKRPVKPEELEFD
ncbi:hypothetical protein DUNSADRAFT_17939 [Dunaliella salina]|uniref:Uncharacterized protein n=1 Tax=Dunaliella salina TaxID=3046 RepID=A0ABQ7H928_DUNSA|nr:hypothetical protein DUNSADRAFT_17939 [Dunaliella salina]|eukprot:KAF5843361.1 hypothetical protein DUNSADRAFT_17939 [Dunaliella salina]